MMKRFIVPEWVLEHNFFYDPSNLSKERIEIIRKGLEKFGTETPNVSIVIPAYNEEASLLRALSSFSRMATKHKAELIVVNNNSNDRTQEILEVCAVKTVFAQRQGISYARQAGLEAAKGKYILSADADSIYPVYWIDTLVEPLMNKDEVSCPYGTYSFIPSSGNSRVSLGFYEMMAEAFFKIKRKQRECVNVMGFNFAFRKEDAFKVGGYSHNLQRNRTGRSEDGWMAYQLMKVGKLCRVDDLKGRAWTSDRRLMADGSLAKAFQNRAKKELKRLSLYFNSRYAVHSE